MSKQAEVYHHLILLLNEVSEGAFDLDSSNFFRGFFEDEGLLAFLGYFKKEYIERINSGLHVIE